ncbi:helix-turn-helix transcriptional regulator [Porifericola rhodea]|uniref:AraC family transcriptional regulator n=1 Tax=Porifericola rhodea TaxID=930972 RepID=UPI0026665568|nr:helix-turn-helix domain-containing protein [Porifericola rhodea]WKN31176.1 helix-turn-helix transcriptional regulator [Porifericola rhodea]
MSDIPKLRFKKDSEHALEFEIAHLSKLFRQKYEDHDPFKSHRLNFYAIILVTEGAAGEHLIDFKPYTFQKGSLIFIAKEQVHAFSSLKNNGGYIIFFTDHFLSKSVVSKDAIFLQQLFSYQLYHPIVRLKEEELNEFETLVIMAKAESKQKDDKSKEDIMRTYLHLLLLKSQRLRQEYNDTSKPAYYADFVRFQQLLLNNLYRSRNVSYYADQLNMSSKKLNMISREIVNMSVKDYIVAYLILEVKRLLANSSLTINEVSYKVGFHEPTNFVKFVKKHTSLTPSQLRETLY